MPANLSSANNSEQFQPPEYSGQKSTSQDVKRDFALADMGRKFATAPTKQPKKAKRK